MARAAPLPFDLDLGVPGIVRDSTLPPACTIAYLVTDVATNDTYAMRMQITPLPNATAVAGKMPCPAAVPARVAARAIDACAIRAADARTCVFADMSRGFAQAREIANTAENASRCASDVSTFIGMACWKSDGLDVCNVGCGLSRQEAEKAARERCEAKHGRTCAAAASLPVLTP